METLETREELLYTMFLHANCNSQDEGIEIVRVHYPEHQLKVMAQSVDLRVYCVDQTSKVSGLCSVPPGGFKRNGVRTERRAGRGSLIKKRCNFWPAFLSRIARNPRGSFVAPLLVNPQRR